MTSLAIHLSASAAGAPVPPEFFGMHMNLGGKRAEFGWPSIAFGSLRLMHPDLGWSGLEPAPGRWNWATMDKVVADALDRGVEPVLTLGFTPDWAARKRQGGPVLDKWEALYPPRDLEAWRRYVHEVAARYRGKVRWFELWNEPHFTETDKVDHGFSVNDMVAMARVAREALLAVDGGNRLLSFSPPGADRGIRRLELFFERGGGAHIDAIGFHFYTTPPSPEAILPLALRLRAMADRRGLSKLPIWNTESGYQTEDPEHGVRPGPVNRQGDRHLAQAEAAAFVPRSLLMGLQAGIERYYWYGWAIRAYSLSADRGRVPSPAGLAFVTTRRWLLGMRFLGCAETPAGLWRCRLARPSDGEPVEVIWSTNGATQVPRGDALHAESIFGETISLTSSPSIEVDATPRLLKRSPARWAASP